MAGGPERAAVAPHVDAIAQKRREEEGEVAGEHLPQRQSQPGLARQLPRHIQLQLAAACQAQRDGRIAMVPASPVAALHRARPGPCACGLRGGAAAQPGSRARGACTPEMRPHLQRKPAAGSAACAHSSLPLACLAQGAHRARSSPSAGLTQAMPWSSSVTENRDWRARTNCANASSWLCPRRNRQLGSPWAGSRLCRCCSRCAPFCCSSHTQRRSRTKVSSCRAQEAALGKPPPHTCHTQASAPTSSRLGALKALQAPALTQ